MIKHIIRALIVMITIVILSIVHNQPWTYFDFMTLYFVSYLFSIEFDKVKK